MQSFIFGLQGEDPRSDEESRQAGGADEEN